MEHEQIELRAARAPLRILISFRGNLKELQPMDILDKHFKRPRNMYRANDYEFDERFSFLCVYATDELSLGVTCAFRYRASSVIIGRIRDGF